MTVTRDEMTRLEARVGTQEALIKSIVDPMRELSKQIAENTTQVSLLCQKLDHTEEKAHRIEAVQIDQGKRIGQLEIDMNTVKTRQQGWISTVERIAYPLIIAALVTYFQIGN